MSKGRGRGNAESTNSNFDNSHKRAYEPPLDEEDLLTFPEEFEWISNQNTRPLGLELKWKEGPIKLNVDGETNFISELLLRNLLLSKGIVDGIEDWKFRKARNRSNPFEGVNTGSFVNRSWLKMANMDSLFENLFTSPKQEDNTHGLSDEEVLTFADICGGPGGFVEYVLWRKNNNAKGFGITLKSGREDYKHLKFKNANSKCFQTHYGILGDGDITKNENIDEFVRFVMENTKNQGVHFAMADGASDSDSDCKEIAFQRIFLCQIVAALRLLKPGGHLVTNMFDVIAPFTAGLVYILYKCFERICIFKPVTCRPANSERFIICKNRISDTSTVTKYLMQVNSEMEKLYPGDESSDSMVTEIVSMDTILGDQQFCEYVTKTNEKISKIQIQSLKKKKVPTATLR